MVTLFMRNGHKEVQVDPLWAVLEALIYGRRWRGNGFTNSLSRRFTHLLPSAALADRLCCQRKQSKSTSVADFEKFSFVLLYLD